MARTNYAAFYALLKSMPGASKEDLVLQWTNGRTASLKEMSEREYSLMIRQLRQQVDSLEEKKKARSAVLKQFQLYGIDTTDWDAVDRFCCNARIAGKPFRYLTIPELKALRVKMLSIRNKAELKGYEQRRAALGAEITKGQLPN
ncbi:hypothetical protein [uncultured Porphyromonas sp.]|uniref:hypothetical protein n=1 Tax=uncultured Porphyromonas sp. TaxID=159274 RepID=UPI0025835880|nr:hypothetical protein [uncultured Porphyromonas sp.]